MADNSLLSASVATSLPDQTVTFLLNLQNRHAPLSYRSDNRKEVASKETRGKQQSKLYRRMVAGLAVSAGPPSRPHQSPKQLMLS